MAERDEPYDDDDAPEGRKPSRDDKRMAALHERALSRFDSVAVPQAELRSQSLNDRRFVTIPGAMWEGTWGELYENAPRPEVDKITKSLEKIEGDYRENRIIPDFVPAGDASDEETADTLDGLHRADSYHFKAQQARDNAFQEAIRGGFGAYRLATVEADEDDPENDEQRVNPGLTIVDADQSVYFDPGSKVYDKSDAEWAFVVTADPRAEAKAKWGEDIVEWPEYRRTWIFDWYTPDVVRTAEYYEVERVDDELLTFSNKVTEEVQKFWASEIDADEIKELTDLGWTKTTKKAKRRRVHMYILNGNTVLRDCGFIAGGCIPIVPVYGRRDFVDNMERWRGHVQKRKDRQRIYNSSVANVVETQSTSPREVPIFAAEQMDPALADEWARANIDRLPFLRVHPLRNEDGSIAAAGPIGKVEPPQVQPATAALLQIASADLTDEDDNADEVKANTSAEAMDIAAARVDAKSGIYLDNMRQSIQREAEIYLAMAREVYFEPGRKVDTLTMDGQDGQATLVEPVMDQNGVYRIRNDLTRGKYKVVADVQESTATKRQKTVKQNMEIASVAVTAQAMDLAQAALLTAVMNQDGEGLHDMQAFARNRLISLGVVKPTPEEQQQIEAAQQAQQSGQPDPQSMALLAAASNQQSQAQLNNAKAVQTLADAHLKTAQADAVGGPERGPERAPEAPSGFQAANDQANVADTLASARLKEAQANKLSEDVADQRIRTGHQIEMERRQQAHAERTTGSNG
jgi:hypothetical protein